MPQAFLDHLEDRDRSPTTLRTYKSDLTCFANRSKQINNKSMTPAPVTFLDIKEHRHHSST